MAQANFYPSSRGHRSGYKRSTSGLARPKLATRYRPSSGYGKYKAYAPRSSSKQRTTRYSTGRKKKIYSAKEAVVKKALKTIIGVVKKAKHANIPKLLAGRKARDTIKAAIWMIGGTTRDVMVGYGVQEALRYVLGNMGAGAFALLV